MGTTSDDDNEHIWEELPVLPLNPPAPPTERSTTLSNTNTDTAIHESISRGGAGTPDDCQLIVDSPRQLRSREDQIDVHRRPTQCAQSVIHSLWTRFLRYILQAIRQQTTVSVHVGGIFLLTGISCQIILLSTWYLLFPKESLRAMVFTLVVGSLMLYLNCQDVTALSKLASSPATFIDALEQWDPAILRHVSMAALLIPCLLEMIMIHFLSQLPTHADWISQYNVAVTIMLAGIAYYCHCHQKLPPRESIRFCLLVLYGCAVIATLAMVRFHLHSWNDLYRAMAMMFPLLLANGAYLILYTKPTREDWLSDCVRQALRAALRDTIHDLTHRLQHDEMLQVTMLRWIVDYWSSEPPNRKPSSHVPSQSSSSSTSPQETTATTTITTGHSGKQPHLEWNDLLPMLVAVTDQLAQEVEILQGTPTHGQQHHQKRRDSRSTRSHPDSTMESSDGPIEKIRSMLISMDIDSSAKPAVLAYKRCVERFPPRQRTSILIAVSRRCPACLLCILHLMFSWSSALSATLILVPFMVLEIIRIQTWARELCQDNDGSLLVLIRQLHEERDPMIILLCGDEMMTGSQPRSLLKAWKNICDSVDALQVGLTAMRCVQTSLVTADFADNLLSLAKFCWEVSEHGWMHGLNILLMESLHVKQKSSWRAASRALSNAQTIHRNVRAFLEGEEEILRVVAPILNIFSSLVIAWSAPPIQNIEQKSFVWIEELDATDNKDKSDNANHTARHERVNEKPINSIDTSTALKVRNEEVDGNSGIVVDTLAVINNEKCENDSEISVIKKLSETHQLSEASRSASFSRLPLYGTLLDDLPPSIPDNTDGDHFVTSSLKSANAHRAKFAESVTLDGNGILAQQQKSSIPSEINLHRDVSAGLLNPKPADEEVSSLGPKLKDNKSAITGSSLRDLPFVKKDRSTMEQAGKNDILHLGCNEDSFSPRSSPGHGVSTTGMELLRTDEENWDDDKKSKSEAIDLKDHIGAGLAIFGALLGGIAVAVALHGEDKDRRRRGNGSTSH